MQPIDILLVEDNECDIQLTTEALLSHKIVNNIFIVKEGNEALKYPLNKNLYNNSPSPDLFLLKINLPKLNGNEGLRHVRAIENLNYIPAVMLSSSSSSEDVLKSFNNEAHCYITKPDELVSFIREFISIKNLKTSSETFIKS